MIFQKIMKRNKRQHERVWQCAKRNQEMLTRIQRDIQDTISLKTKTKQKLHKRKTNTTSLLSQDRDWIQFSDKNIPPVAISSPLGGAQLTPYQPSSSEV